MFPLHSNYRRDGATRPLFRSRVSMMASASSSCPDDEESSTRPSTSTSPTKTTTTTTAGTFHRPRPRMWSSTAIPSSSSYLSSGSDYSDGYYSSDDSDSEDEGDDILCDASASADMNDLMVKSTIKNNKKKRRPISPTSCTDFDDCEHYEHDRPTKRCRHRRRDHGSKHVTFARDPVADVRYRPRTPQEDKRALFYSKRDISSFRRDYYDWLDEGHDPSEQYEWNEENVEEEANEQYVISTSSPPATPTKKSTTTCVTPDNSSEDEDGDDAYEEEEED